MKNKKKYGARNTRNVKRNVEYSKLKSQEAVARLEKVKYSIAQKSKFMNTSEFAGNGQTKRVMYTVDEDKIFEYKHCLMFNGINVAFTESHATSRSIFIELPEINPEYRKTEKELQQEFIN